MKSGKKKIKVFSISAVTLISLAISGCQETGPAATNGKVFSIPEFLHAPEVMEATYKWCKENPGERKELPNCVNARYARLKQQNPDYLWKCYKNGIDHACIDEILKGK